MTNAEKLAIIQLSKERKQFIKNKQLIRIIGSKMREGEKKEGDSTRLGRELPQTIFSKGGQSQNSIKQTTIKECILRLQEQRYLKWEHYERQK